VPHLAGRPPKRREDVPGLQRDGSVVSQLRTDSPCGWLGNVPGREEVRSRSTPGLSPQGGGRFSRRWRASAQYSEMSLSSADRRATLAAALGFLALEPREPELARYWPSLQLTAKANSVVVVSAEVRSAGELQPALADARDQRAGIFIWGSPLLTSQSKAICDFALAHRLPTIVTFNDHVSKDGCLIGYAPTAEDLLRRAATYVDRLLRGAKPSDLPVEQPTKFELVINLKTAKALDLTIPPSLLLRADQVIE